MANDEMLMKQYRMNIPLSASEEKRARSLIRQENFKKFESKPLPDERIEKFHHIFDSLKQLSPQTLCMMIDDLGLMKFIEFHPYKEITIDVYQKAKEGKGLSDKQKLVLVQLLINKR